MVSCTTSIVIELLVCINSDLSLSLADESAFSASRSQCVGRFILKVTFVSCDPVGSTQAKFSLGGVTECHPRVSAYSCLVMVV